MFCHFSALFLGLLRRAEPLDADFLAATQRFPDEALGSLLLWLQAATNQSPGEARGPGGGPLRAWGWAGNERKSRKTWN
jgi:hypothetical protein